ncbi:MAG: sigma 54-interacting transcriptional regulator [Desulfobacteraceae bacterium]|nr:sigma 54-interacting transcriptional regulator [Desulfobacteraceae bacterium]
MEPNKDIQKLYEISEALDEHTDMKKSLYKVLSILSESLNLTRGIIFLVDPDKEEIRIEVAHGISENVIKKVRYLAGEGIIGNVIKNGEPAVVPRISKDPLFLNKTNSHNKEKKEFSFICIPVKKKGRIIGAISADRHFDGKSFLENGENILSIVARMIAHHLINLDNSRLERTRLNQENIRLKTELETKFKFSNIIGNSNKMREVMQMISQVSRSNATVLIRGESGTGKELVANSIHYNSHRNKNPFIKLNCAAIPMNLIESELFGHTKGAFAGASSSKKGKFQMADKGTLFLDEIGNMDLSVQVKLLRFLQEKEFEQVGGLKKIRTDIRIIAATNSNLEELVQKELFRSDLYFRLNVFPIYIPSLRMRKTDIILLADHFLEKYSTEHKKNIKRFSTPAIDMMMAYHWPGNVRELENCIERAVILCNDDAVHNFHLPPSLQMEKRPGKTNVQLFDQSVAEFEKKIIIDALKKTKGNIKKSASQIGITVRKFSYKADKYNIQYKEYR